MSYDLPAMRRSLMEYDRSNAYGCLAIALTDILGDYGIVMIDMHEILNLFHFPLASYADYPDTTLAQIAQHVAETIKPPEPYQLDDWAMNQSGLGSSSPSISVEDSINRRLRELKIRRNTKAHQEFLERNASTIAGWLLNRAEQAIETQTVERARKRADLEKFRTKIQKIRDGYWRAIPIAQTLRIAAELPRSTRLDELLVDMSARTGHLIEQATNRIASLSSPLVDPVSQVEYAYLGADEKVAWNLYREKEHGKAVAAEDRTV